MREINAGKTPGYDGFPSEFYRSFHKVLGQQLLALFHEAIERECFPDEINLATIVVLPKYEHSPDRCSSYRPSSLINNKLKIFAKILASRLNQCFWI